MSQHEIPDVPVWGRVLEALAVDDRVTPQLHGFLNLAVPQGVMGGTLYLDVPNDLTAAQLNKRLRAPIMEALAHVEQNGAYDPPAATFRVVVNPDIIDAHLTAPVPIQELTVPAPSMSPKASALLIESSLTRTMTWKPSPCVDFSSWLEPKARSWPRIMMPICEHSASASST